MTPQLVVSVLAAGALGALFRYLVSLSVARRPGFPWAVLVVNLVASAIGGAVLGLAYRGLLSEEWRLVLLTGLAGGISTFSTWSVDTLQLALNGRARVALVSVAANLFLGLGAAAGAFALTYL